MDIYAQNILDRYKSPFHKDKKIISTVSHTEANHSCGDKVTSQLRLENQQIKAYSFAGEGCAISMAAADMLGDLVENMTEEEALNLGKEEIYEMLGIEISVRRSKCALLSLLVLQNSLLIHQKKELVTWSEYHI
jgi:nitrogen fixation NifU-like protein